MNAAPPKDAGAVIPDAPHFPIQFDAAAATPIRIGMAGSPACREVKEST